MKMDREIRREIRKAVRQAIEAETRRRASNGGKARARNLTPEQRHEQAKKAINTRWGKRTTEPTEPTTEPQEVG